MSTTTEGEGEKQRERQRDKDGESELEMEPHTLLRPMNAAQRDKETFIPIVSCAIPKKGQKAQKGLDLEFLQNVSSSDIMKSESETYSSL